MEDRSRQQAADELFARYHGQPAEDRARCVRRLAAEPEPFYDEARRRWLVCRSEHARLVLTDKRFSNDLSKAHSATKSAELASRLAPSAPSVLFLDDPLHTVVRRVLGGRVAGPAVRSHSRDVQVLADDLVHTVVRRPEFGIGRDLVHPLAARILLDMLGFDIPADDELRGLVDDLFSVNGLFDLTAGPEDVRAGRAASARVRERIGGELSARSGLGETFRAAGVDMAIAVSSLEFMLRAGIVTCSCLLANALTSASAVSWRDRPDRGDVERLIVASSPSLEAGRVTLTDVRVGTTRIPAGETVIVLLPAANLEVLDQGTLVRARHVAFGAGQHLCLGAQLVRAELRSLVLALAGTGHPLTVSAVVARQELPAFRGVREAAAALAGPAL